MYLYVQISETVCVLQIQFVWLFFLFFSHWHIFYVESNSTADSHSHILLCCLAESAMLKGTSCVPLTKSALVLELLKIWSKSLM